jgi:hypothetical protein
MENTRKIELYNGGVIEVFEILNETGAETGDLIYDFSDQKFHPVYRLGNTNVCFEKEFQSKIHKVIKSSREKDNLPFE